MRTVKTRLLFVCNILLIVALTSCSKDNPLNPLGCGSGTWALQVTDEAKTWSAAASNYSSDPTPANCNAYKNAAKSYLDALEGVRGCVAGTNKADFDKAINEAKVEVDQANCSG